MGTARAIVFLQAVLIACRAVAQTTGTIEGTLTDPAGAPVGVGEIRVIENRTGAIRQSSLDGQGRYRVLGLPPGPYRIEVRVTGFKAEDRQGLELPAGYTVRSDFSLVLGEAHETVEVRAETPLLSASPADWGGLVQKDKLESLPLNGRDLYDLATQQPGVVAPPAASRANLSYGVGARLAVNGARPNQNDFRMDGISVADASGNAPASAAGRLLGVEALELLSLVTSPFSAEYGRAAGGVLTAVSKSGGNAWHGSVYEFFRHSKLDARNFFDSATPPLRRNQYGGMVSGPVRRERLFFLLNFEAIRESRNRTASVAVPTAEARTGRIPGLAAIAVAPAVVPFLNLYPLPNGRNFGDGTGEFVTALPTAIDEKFGSAKVDWLWKSGWRTFARYTGDGATSSTSDPFRLWLFRFESRYHLVHTNTQWIASPTSIHDFRLGLSRVINSDEGDPPPPSPELSFIPGRPPGNIQVTGLVELFGLRARLQPFANVHNDAQASYLGALIRGAHQLKIGAGMDWIQFNRLNASAAQGIYTFESLAAFLAGRARTGELVLPGSSLALQFRQNQYFVFVQDEFKIGRRLSASAGLRWEPYSAFRETGGRAVHARLPIESPQICAGGPLYRNPSRGNFAPRAGVAWDIDGHGRTVFRAGGGIFYEALGSQSMTASRGYGPPTYIRYGVTAPVFPNLLESALATTALPSLDLPDYDVLQPYVAQWQATLQRQIGPRTVASAGYVGTRGAHLIGTVGNVNPPRPQRLADGTLFFAAGAPRLNPALDRLTMGRTQFNLFHHALVANLDQHLSHGLRFQVRYSWARTIDESSSPVLRDYVGTDFIPNMFNYRANRGPSEYHLSHAFGSNFTWQLPLTRRGIGGWELSGLVQAQSGPPFNPRTGFDRARLQASGVTGDLGQRPDWAGGVDSVVLGGPDRYFNPLAFSLPAVGVFGNLGRNTVFGPGLVNLDAALQKSFRLAERVQLRFRAEAFNLANRANFQLPSQLNLFNNTGQRVGAAGRITETTTGARQIQLTLRLSF